MMLAIAHHYYQEKVPLLQWLVRIYLQENYSNQTVTTKLLLSNMKNTFKPFINKKQKAAQVFAKSFVPKSDFGIWLRNKVFKLMSVWLFQKYY